MNSIVGIGELLWDVYPDGRKVAGGAPFNFAFHCHQLGHPAVIVSRVGDDDLGRELREEVRRLGLSDEFIQTDHDHPTGTVRVSLDANRVPTYTIAEDVAWDHIAWNDQLRQLARHSRAVCYGTLAWRSHFEPLDRLITEHRQVTRPPCVVFDVNLRQHYYEEDILDAGAGRCTILKMSEEDYLELVARYPTRPTDPFGMARSLADQPEEDFIVILSMGARGCVVESAAARFTEPGIPARVVDTVGAGDAFTAAMVCLHLEGRPLRECARFANYYAAQVCEHQGATPRIDRAGVERAAFGSP
ncbi:MAG: aminoimidazole riboside kinase [Gemmataceae bacterium]|nr:aminoimidazole riboside kinase [Gemmataceae bacterium]